MPIFINTNVTSIVAQRNLANNTEKLNQSLERLSSGYRINRAADDAAGLTISENLKSQINGINTALQNAQDGISILQITEGTMSVMTDNLQRIRELTVQAANDTNARAQRSAIESEIQARLEDNQRIVKAASFNGIKLLTGSATNARLQIGAESTLSTNTLNITSALATTTATAMGVLGAATSAGFTTISAIQFTTGSVARKFLNDVSAALNQISARRAKVGAMQNELNSTVQNLQLSNQNFTASESRIRDLDVASETARLTQLQILQQASISILSQANQTPNLVLKLLQ